MMAKLLYLSIFSLLRHYKCIYLEMRLPFVKKTHILWSFFQHCIFCHEINGFHRSSNHSWNSAYCEVVCCSEKFGKIANLNQIFSLYPWLWNSPHGLSNRAPPHTLNTSITFNNKIATTSKHIANCFTKQFTNTVKHATHKTNRHINRATHNIQGYNTLTTSQVQEAIKQRKNNNSQSPDKLNIRHLKHIGPLGLAFLTSMFKTDLNKNIIPHTWKLANIVPIPKPNKDTDKGTSYRPISVLSVIAKTLEKSLLPYITANIPYTPMQHGYKTQHSTVTALHTLNNTVAKGFNQMAPLREQSL